MKKLNYILLLAITGTMMNFACKKKETTADVSPTPYSVQMTDAPGPYDAVNIDLKSVEITGDNGSTVTLNTVPGIYNLLQLNNGVNALIATADLNLSSVEQIRLILGPNNTIVVDSVSYPLSTPSAEQSGLKLQVHQELQPGVAYGVLLDFDANQSIVQTGSGQYKLKPVIRTVEVALSGSIKGAILPAGLITAVTATINGVSYSSYVNSNGNFIIKGLAAGTYSVSLNPALPYLPVIVNAVVVSVGTSTDMGVIQF